MPAYGALDPAILGQLINGNDFVDSAVVADASGIGYGSAVFEANGQPGLAFNAKSDVLSFVLSAAFITGNTIAGNVNGQAYSVPFATDDATTFANLVKALNLLTGTRAVGDFAIRTITITYAGATASASGTVTGGASQATVTVTTSATVSLLGVAVHSHTAYAGVAKADFQAAVGVLRIGLIWVKAGAAVLSQERAYWDPTNLVFTNVSSGNIVTPWYFRASGAANDLVILDVTKPIAATGV
jgi:hypothetical protein